MLIRNIKLINFRQFKEEDIYFSCDSEKKFTVILGNNTFGKTTLVKSFLWCLYKQNTFNDPILLNKDVVNSMYPGQSNEVKVAIELEHNNYSYKITTKQIYTLTTSEQLTYTKPDTNIVKLSGEGAIPISKEKIIQEIDEILSLDLSPYFFFDGETNKIEMISRKTNLTQAVSQIMGLKKMEALRNYFDQTKAENVISKFMNSLTSEDPTLYLTLQEKLNEKINEKDAKENEIHTNESEISKLTMQLTSKQAELEANKDIENLQKEKKRLSEEIEKNKNIKNNDFKSTIDLLNSHNSFLKYLFSYSYKNYSVKQKLLNCSFKTERSLSHIDEGAVDELIERGYCLCGAKIESDNEAYKHLIESKMYMAPKNFGKHIQNFCENEDQNSSYSPSALENIIDKTNNVLNAIEKMDNIKEELNVIKTQIEGRPDVGEIQKDINRIEDQIKYLDATNKYISNKIIPEINKEIINLTKRIEENSDNSEKNKKVQKCIDYCKFIYDLLDKSLIKKKDEIRSKLESEVMLVFKDMFHGNRRIIIDDQFKISTVTELNEKLDISAGLETVQNYAFVAGLMKLVKEKMLSIDVFDDETYDEIYPLVMDAPFSNTDEQHIRNISLALPKYCNQIIMVVMEKDFKHASEVISNITGKMYRINKHSETYATIEEVY